MRFFVTGATGFVGQGVVKELIDGGHTVLGLARADKTAAQLKSQGAESIQGTLEDVEVLKKAASECDGVIHLAFVHDFADFEKTCAIDRNAITAMGSALAAAPGGGDRPLIITSGTMMLQGVENGDEDSEASKTNPFAALRGASETVCLDFAKQGVRAMVIRLPPTTHGPGVSGFAGVLVQIALKHGVSAYVGDGQNVWSACHRDDAARLYLLAAEKGKAGAIYQAVGEEAVPLKDLATEIGKQMGVPVKSISEDKVQEHFEWFFFGPTANNPATSEKTKQRLGWNPTHPTLIEDVPTIIKFMKENPPAF